ncbi:MAG: hypothetical protein RBR41_14125 [Desulfovibrio sp.]|uniref:hypothetical protein n=1 Tax=Desulfovibrio sp. TaxID=885 RepID=UPI002A36779C|nr:hypothetical protein [Desulfovibrio sp.]MDY0260786.1 hypothetical protein [Desulfovibrio sp.]
MTDRIRRIIIISLLIMLVLALLAGAVQTYRLSAASARVDKLALDLDAEKRRADGLEGQLRQARSSVNALGQFGADTQNNCADTLEKFLAIPGLAALPVSTPESQEPVPGTIAEPAGDGAAMRTSLTRKGAATGAAPASAPPDDAAFTEFLNAF